jgi:hypothetical protein
LGLAILLHRLRPSSAYDHHCSLRCLDQVQIFNQKNDKDAGQRVDGSVAPASWWPERPFHLNWCHAQTSRALADPLKPLQPRQTQLAAGRGEGTSQRAKAGGDHKLVRTDHRTRTLKPLLVTPTGSGFGHDTLKGSVKRKNAIGRRTTNGVPGDSRGGLGASGGLDPNPARIDNPHVHAALEAVEARAHSALTRIVREHTFVGLVEGTQVLLQQGSKLFLVNVEPLSRDLMLQQALRRCGQFAAVVLQPPVEVASAVSMGLESQAVEGRLSDADGNRVRSRCWLH